VFYFQRKLHLLVLVSFGPAVPPAAACYAATLDLSESTATVQLVTRPLPCSCGFAPVDGTELVLGFWAVGIRHQLQLAGPVYRN
jgi:hypothetical protein